MVTTNYIYFLVGQDCGKLGESCEPGRCPPLLTRVQYLTWCRRWS